MKIKNIRIVNYKSIKDSGRLELGENFTVVVGQNNAGKTAFIERLSFSSLENNAFQGSDRDDRTVVNPQSINEVELKFAGKEFDWLLRTADKSTVLEVPNLSLGDPQKYYDSNFLPNTHEASLIFERGVWLNPKRESQLSDGGIFRASSNREWVTYIGPDNATRNSTADFLASIAPDYFSYVFKAERLNIASGVSQGNLILNPDASNLAGALQQLQGRHVDMFDSLNSHLRFIIPSVEGVTTAPQQSNPEKVEILVWNKGSSKGFPLSSCGTGIGQVLAILFVVITSEFEKIVVIDEPNNRAQFSTS